MMLRHLLFIIGRFCGLTRWTLRNFNIHEINTLMFQTCLLFLFIKMVGVTERLIYS